MAGKFEVYKDTGGELGFRPKAGNGQVVLTSEGYSARASAMNGIKSVQTNCKDEKCFDKSETARGKSRFNMTTTPLFTVTIPFNSFVE
jgi:uncharacterized protein YegP (UPF0339 family)